MGITDLSLFILAGLLLNITPGADMLYILSNAFSKGFKTSVIAALGIGSGCFVHVILAAAGLSAILHSSPTAFMFVKYIGVIYLVYLGINMLINKNQNQSITIEKKEKSLKKVFWQGFFINVLNPKVALFFITFLPQFIDINSSHKVLAPLILGVIFIIVGTIVNILIAYFSLKLSSNFSFTKYISTIVKKVVGMMFIGFGIKLALDKA